MSKPDTLGPRQLELRLAEELERLPGVVAAAVHLGDNGDVHDVFIAAGPGVALAPIRDAAGDALRNAGLTASPSKLRIGSLEPGTGTAPPPGPAPAVAAAAPAAALDEGPAPWQGRFLLMEGVDVERSSSHVTCRVHLIRLEERFQGECTELDTELGRIRASARAALAAAEKTSPAFLGLEGAQLVELFSRRYIVVSVEASAARRFVVLSGIMALDGARSMEEAAALAALRAIERFISW